jgi:nucleotide-binding universal stress UspA family protein
MASTNNSFTIVVGIDFSETTDPTLDQAFEFGSRRGGADVHVVFVEDELTTPRVPAADPDRAAHATEALQRVQRRASDRLVHLANTLTLNLGHVVAHVRHGSPAENIVQLASHLDADLIVVGTHGRRGFERLLLGSVAERVLRVARCAVLVVRPKDHEGLGKVPEIEPPCPDCVVARRESGGAKLWCARHSEHHIRPHTYHYVTSGMSTSDPVAMGAGESTPTQHA